MGNKNELQINHRRDQVQEMFLKQHTYQEIADKLGVCYETVAKDVKEIKKANKEYLLKHPLLKERKVEKIFEAVETLTIAMRESYKIAEDEKVSDRNKLDALDLIRKIVMDKAKLLGLLGPEVEVRINIELLKNKIIQVLAIMRDEIEDDELKLKIIKRMKEEIVGDMDEAQAS